MYVRGFAMDMTKLASCEDVTLRRCYIMYDPSGVGSSVGNALACFDVVVLVDERKDGAMAIPVVSAYMR